MSDDAGVDRLRELVGTEVVVSTGLSDVEQDDKRPETDSEIAELMNKYEPIKQGLHRITENVDKINKLKQTHKRVVNDKEKKEIMGELDQVMSQTTGTAANIKKSLDEIKKLDEEYKRKHKDSAKTQVRLNLYSTNIRRFQTVMNQYNAASLDFKQALKDTTRRHIRIVNTDLTDEEVEKIVDSGETNVFKKALEVENLQNVVREIEERHADILKLERQVIEVYELFKDLNTLVELQQETLDVIEHRIQNASGYTKQAEKELVKAVEYQKSARKKMCCLLILVLLILIVIIIVVVTMKN